jgi:TolB protein
MQTTFFALSCIWFSFLLSSPAYSEGGAYISVGTAKTRKTVLAIAPFRTRQDAKNLSTTLKTLEETLKADLGFMDLFRFLDPSAFLETGNPGVTAGSFKMSDWSSIGAEFLLKMEVGASPSELTLEVYLYEVASGKTSLAKRYVGKPGDEKLLAHTVGNDIIKTLTGNEGIFLSKIVMSCEKGGRKEIFMMDYDGSNVKQITQHNSVAMGPTWSPDGTKIAYSLITKNKKNIKNINLYEFDFKTNSAKLLSDRTGINSGANYHPNGRNIVLTMSFLGVPDIFVFDPVASTVTRLTKTDSVEVDPAYSPDGKNIAFVSSRAGRPMIYRMNADGSNVTRLTFAGTYNATPNWSPDGKRLVFAGWVDRSFDIFTMSASGSNLERLTKGQGNNEDPAFSPDGNFVVFSSNRSGGKQVYVMNTDGNYVKRLTYGLGECVGPKWR